jgi:hypothetical protein
MLFSVAGQTIEAIFLPGWILVDIVGQKTGYKQKFKRMDQLYMDPTWPGVGL